VKYFQRMQTHYFEINQTEHCRTVTMFEK